MPAVKPRLYGIPNCDTVKRARAWFAARGVDVDFVDYKKTPPTRALLEGWLAHVDADALVNRSGTTWRKLDDTARASAANRDGAIALMVANPPSSGVPSSSTVVPSWSASTPTATSGPFMGDTLDLARAMIARRSVTPEDGGCQTLMQDRLAPLGFQFEIIESADVVNLWARRGTARPWSASPATPTSCRPARSISGTATRSCRPSATASCTAAARPT